MTNNDAAQVATDKKSYGQILDEEIRTATTEMRRNSVGLLLSAISAGLDIGFSLLLMAAVLTWMGDSASPLLQKIIVANMYSIGFIFVNLGRSELFTEHTTVMMFPTLRGRATTSELVRVWSVVYVGNLSGAVLFAALVAFFGPARGIINPDAFGQIASDVVSSRWWIIAVSGVMAGWMMGILSWLATATKETIAQIACVWLVTTAIGLAGLHHCVAGTVEVLAGVFSGRGATPADYGCFLLWATLGNIAGGVLFASIKYAHATRGHESGAESACQ